MSVHRCFPAVVDVDVMCGAQCQMRSRDVARLSVVEELFYISTAELGRGTD